MDDALWFGDKTMGKWFLDIRTQLGYTQKEFSEILGYTVFEISRFENDVRKIPKCTRVCVMMMFICFQKGDLVMQKLVSSPRIHKALHQVVTAKLRVSNNNN